MKPVEADLAFIPEGRLQALLDIQQADALGLLILVVGRQQSPGAVVAHLEVQAPVDQFRIEVDRGRLDRTADGELDAVLEQRLQQEAWHSGLAHPVLHVQRDIEPVAEAHFLNAEIEVQRFQLLFKRVLDLVRMIERDAQIVPDLRQHVGRAGCIALAHEPGDRVERIEQEVRIELVFQHAQLRVADELLGFQAPQCLALGDLAGPQGFVLRLHCALVLHDPVAVIFQRIIAERPGAEDDDGGEHPAAPVGKRDRLACQPGEGIEPKQRPDERCGQHGDGIDDDPPDHRHVPGPGCNPAQRMADKDTEHRLQHRVDHRGQLAGIVPERQAEIAEQAHGAPAGHLEKPVLAGIRLHADTQSPEHAVGGFNGGHDPNDIENGVPIKPMR